MHKKRVLKSYFRGSRKLLQAHEKVCDENETNKQRKKNDTRVKNIIDGRRAFIRYTQKTCAMDINQLQIDDC